eukprot:3941342-Rhodomonas_salina.2
MVVSPCVCHAMCGTERVYAAIHVCCALCSTERAYAALRVCCPTRMLRVFGTERAYGAVGKMGGASKAFAVEEVSLRVCFAMSGTDVAYGGIALRVCCAMSGTDRAYGGITLRACCASPHNLRARYAMSGTGIAYSTVALHACYAMSGTETASAWTVNFVIAPRLKGMRKKGEVSSRTPIACAAYSNARNRIPGTKIVRKLWGNAQERRGTTTDTDTDTDTDKQTHRHRHSPVLP